VAPGEHAYPWSQFEQADAFTKLYFPAPHSEGAMAPGGQANPAGHSMQAPEPSTLKEPGAQDPAHIFWPGVENRPAWHTPLQFDDTWAVVFPNLVGSTMHGGRLTTPSQAKPQVKLWSMVTGPQGTP
jgi:hypothetical protein